MAGNAAGIAPKRPASIPTCPSAARRSIRLKAELGDPSKSPKNFRWGWAISSLFRICEVLPGRDASTGSATRQEAVAEERQHHERDRDVQPITLPGESRDREGDTGNRRRDEQKQPELNQAAAM
jgi:hypothetical protein